MENITSNSGDWDYEDDFDPSVLNPALCHYHLLSRLESKKQPSLIVEQDPFYIPLSQFVALLLSDFMIRFNIMYSLRAVQCSG